MRSSCLRSLLLILGIASSLNAAPVPEIPPALKPWESWATWADRDRDCPTTYQSAENPLRFWPSQLKIAIDASGGKFDLSVNTFAATWVPLPGNPEVWPLTVKADGQPVPVVVHDEMPSIVLSAGLHRVEGVYRWTEIPQGLKIPPEIGILSLTVARKP